MRSSVPDTCWPSDNALGIPTLRLDRQADAIDFPVMQWGSGKGGRKQRNLGTWAFFTDDYRFESVWSSPTIVTETGCRTIIEPNFSVFSQYPTAVAAWQTYRKRWLARYWQEQGIRTVVDLNVAIEHAETNLLGVPWGWRAYATRGYSDRLEELQYEFALACSRRGSADVLFLVWGGGVEVERLCNRFGWTHVSEPRTVIRESKQTRLLPPHQERLPILEEPWAREQVEAGEQAGQAEAEAGAPEQAVDLAFLSQ